MTISNYHRREKHQVARLELILELNVKGSLVGTGREKGQICVGVLSTTEALHAKKDSSHSWHTTECDECKTIGGCLLHSREHFDTVVSACTSTAGG